MKSVNRSAASIYSERQLKDFSLSEEFVLSANSSGSEDITTEHKVLAHNPMCGDRFEILFSEGSGNIEPIYYSGDGCMLSRASAHLLCLSLKSRKSSELAGLKGQLKQVLDGSATKGTEIQVQPEELAVFKQVQEFPLRHRCVMLVWDAVDKFLSDREKERGS